MKTNRSTSTTHLAVILYKQRLTERKRHTVNNIHEY